MKRMKNNKNTLYDLILRCQDNDNDGFGELISMFQPLLRKYAFLLNYTDAYDDVYDCFIDCIYKIPLQKLKTSENDAVVLAYIKTSMKNAYIALSRRNGKFKSQISLEDLEIQKEQHCFLQTDFDEHILKDELKQLLSPREAMLIEAEIFNGYSDSEIAKSLGISRQAVNKQYRKAVEKVKKYYENKL